ncbi:hypothetical protein D9M70_562740 [compost metagenome]
MHARGDAFLQRLDRAQQVRPGVAAFATRRQHGASQHHGNRQAQQQEGEGRGAVGQGVGAVQQQHAVMAALHRLDDGLAHGQPVGLAHVGAVDQRQQLLEAKGRCRALAGQLLAHARLEAAGRGQAAGTLQHADGAAGIEHE